MEYEIRRRSALAPQFEQEELLELLPFLEGYNCSPLISRIKLNYSKLDVVRKLREAVEKNNPSQRLNKRAPDVFAALYTDRRILFAQTREYGYRNSMYDFLAHTKTNVMLQKEYETKNGLEPSPPPQYVPKISPEQSKRLEEQIRKARAFDWAARQSLTPYLRCFLHPTEGDAGKRFAKRPVSRDPYNVDLSDVVVQLRSAFRDYWEAVYGGERSTSGFKGWSPYFVHSFQNDETLAPYYLDRPDVIFHLVRDHRAKLIRKGEKAYAVRTILKASLDVPITQATQRADMLLFKSIVKACRMGCDIIHIKFDSDAWMNLWMFLQRGIECLSFEPYDLLTYGGCFSRLLWYDRLKEPLDFWLRDKMFGNGVPFFLDLFRTATNKIGPPISTPASSYHKIAADPKTYADFIASYQDLLLNPAESQNAMSKWKLLGQFSKSTGWNYVKVLPSEDEMIRYVPICNADENQELLLNILKYSDSYFEYNYPTPLSISRKKVKLKEPVLKTYWLDLRNLLFEWFLLQSLCFLRWRDLMETALILLERNEKEPV